MIQKKFLTLKEAGDYLGISETELYRVVSKGKIPTYKIGGIYTRFKVDDLDSFRSKANNKTLLNNNVSTFTDKIKDFFYFNDFYIYSGIAITIIVYCIFK